MPGNQELLRKWSFWPYSNVTEWVRRSRGLSDETRVGQQEPSKFPKMFIRHSDLAVASDDYKLPTCQLQAPPVSLQLAPIT